MEKYLLQLFNLADTLNQKQDKVYAQITYYADNNKTLEICIRLKENYDFVETCRIQLKVSPEQKLKMITDLFNTYVGGDSNE